ncbi:hypothetical protein CDN99_24525 [Roseateles aquatilis]|uniref:DUF6484 domain-containing protein n=1 Tax=Roseateles aquatilis TaxID=431061 RepID=A0A246IW55_9BURK|nr:DUF6484 domain-containing protein [Roseateles aquatilis]OWQ84458.1 hypothetical protein CDN99_24525 [Roseateles aquatilis]
MTESQTTLSPRSGSAAAGPSSMPQVGELLALLDGGVTAFVGLPGGEPIPPVAPAAPAVRTARARTVVDLHAGHVGHSVLLVFEDGDRERPVVIGVVRGADTPAAAEVAGVTHAEVDADGEHLVVTARHALTLRCGKARLTLRADGRIELRGEEILAQAVGAHRVQGGSVHLN